MSEIKDYIKSLFWFFASAKFLFYVACVPAFIYIAPLCNLVPAFSDFVFRTEINDSFLPDITRIVILAAPLTLYILAKMFGIFKKIDKLNFFISLCIVIILSFLLTQMSKMSILLSLIFFIFIIICLILNIFKVFTARQYGDNFDFIASLLYKIFVASLFVMYGHFILTNFDMANSFEIEVSFVMYFLIFDFLLYKFFNFLTKKFTLFKVIGYYFSFEFYQSVYFKIKNRLYSNE